MTGPADMAYNKSGRQTQSRRPMEGACGLRAIFIFIQVSVAQLDRAFAS